MGKPKEQYRVLRALCETWREGQHRFTTSLEGTQTGWELGISRYCPVDGQEPTGLTWIRVSDTVQPRLTKALHELAGDDLIECYAMRGSAFVLHPTQQGGAPLRIYGSALYALMEACDAPAVQTPLTASWSYAGHIPLTLTEAEETAALRSGVLTLEQLADLLHQMRGISFAQARILAADYMDADNAARTVPAKFFSAYLNLPQNLSRFDFERMGQGLDVCRKARADEQSRLFFAEQAADNLRLDLYRACESAQEIGVVFLPPDPLCPGEEFSPTGTAAIRCPVQGGVQEQPVQPGNKEVTMSKYSIPLRSRNMIFDAAVEGHVIRVLGKDNEPRPISECRDLVYDSDELCIAFRAGDKWGYADRLTGEIISPAVWDYADDFHGGYARVCIGCAPVSAEETGFVLPERGKWGCIDKSGRLVIDVQYDELWYLGVPATNLAVVRRGKQFGCVGLDGETVLPVVYDELRVAKEWITVQKDGLWGMLDLKGIAIYPISFQRFVPMDKASGLAQMSDGLWTFFCRGVPVFEGAQSVWCAQSRFMTGPERVCTYLLAELNGLFALTCGDGRLLTARPVPLKDAWELANHAACTVLRFQKWLSE